VADDGVEIWCGGVNTWECDEMGHLNVRFWGAKAMEGLAGLAARLGMPQAFAPHADTTLIVREQHIRFLREARAGASLSMTGAVVEMSETEARLLLIVRHASGEPAATFQLLVAHATARDLRPFPWPARIRARAADLAAPVPAFAAPRSIPLVPTIPRAGLAAAQALGLIRIGLGVIGPDECDAFGRMRSELVIGRISDGVSRLFHHQSEEAAEAGRRVGGAVLEYRVLHLDWPRAGDGVAIYSGFAGCEARTRRLIHWLVDPQSGRVWASAEAVAVSLDLDTRRIIDLPPQTQAAYRAQSVPGLTL